MKRIVSTLRRIGFVAVVLTLVIGAGVTAMVVSSDSASSQAVVHRQDRLNLSKSLATLAFGYFGQLAESQLVVAKGLASSVAAPTSQVNGQLTTAVAGLPGQPIAVLTDLSGHTLAFTKNAPDLAGPMAPVENMLSRDLVAGQPGISPIIFVENHPTIAIAVPVLTARGAASGVLVVAYNLLNLPVASYVQQLQIGTDALTSVVDQNGRMVTAINASQIGKAEPPSVLAAMRKIGGKTGIRDTSGSTPLVVSAAPVGLAGWTLVVEQPAPQFYGSLWHADDLVRWILLALLLVVAISLLLLHVRRQAAVHAIAEMALVDTLTGLPNRVAFTQALDASLQRHRRDGLDVALLFCDLDGFKSVNDRLGHGVGDRLLLAVADRFRSVLANSEQGRTAMARLGGDEFTVLLEARQATPHAQHLADALTESLDEPFVLGAEEVSIGVSVGVAYAQPGRDLLRDADLAMYRTKAVRRAARAAETPDDVSASVA